MTGEKWYAYAFNEAKKAEDIADNAVGIIGAAMWMFNTIANCGIMAGVGPNGYTLQYLENPKIDEASSKRLLLTISACLNLQHLPHEEAKKPIPIISPSKFSLKRHVEKYES